MHAHFFSIYFSFGYTTVRWLTNYSLNRPHKVLGPTALNYSFMHFLQDMSLGDFHHQLIAKSLDLFPSLTEEDLKPYLLRSRATNAYDAVTLLAKSVGVALRQDGDSCDIDFGVLQAAMENVFMVRFSTHCI